MIELLNRKVNAPTPPPPNTNRPVPAPPNAMAISHVIIVIRGWMDAQSPDLHVVNTPD